MTLSSAVIGEISYFTLRRLENVSIQTCVIVFVTGKMMARSE